MFTVNVGYCGGIQKYDAVCFYTFFLESSVIEAHLWLLATQDVCETYGQIAVRYHHLPLPTSVPATNISVNDELCS